MGRNTQTHVRLDTYLFSLTLPHPLRRVGIREHKHELHFQNYLRYNFHIKAAKELLRNKHKLSEKKHRITRVKRNADANLCVI